MASLSLRLKSLKHHHQHHHHQPLLTFAHLYSSSSNNDDEGTSPENDTNFFSDIKSRLTQQKSSNQHHQRPLPRFKPSDFPSQSSSSPSFDEVRKNLADFRLRSSDFTRGTVGLQKPISLKGVFDKNGSKPNANSPIGGTGNISFDAIKSSLQRMKMNQGGVKVKNSFSLNPPNLGNVNGGVGGGGVKSSVIGGSIDSLPGGVFGKEIEEAEAARKGKDPSAKCMLTYTYNAEELGKKLRPDVSKRKPGAGEEKEGWFSLSELQQRIGKLREIEEKHSGKGFRGLRQGISFLKLSEVENFRKAAVFPSR